MATCRGCGTPLDGLAPQARWCSDACRKRTARSGQREARAAAFQARLAELDGQGPVASATRRELEELGVADTWRGVVLYLLAQYIDATDSGHDLVALSKEFRRGLKDVTKGADLPGSRMDEVTRRRLLRSRTIESVSHING